MSELTTGTVSLLFSDIEGSTALLKRLGPAYAAALDGQRRVLRKAWADHGGTELGTEGDSFYVVFPTAEAAVAAASQGQRDLAAFEWPAGEQVRVRMGIHTGSPSVHDGAYVGMDVHRAARIAGAAHGGQVLVSAATAELASEGLPDRVGLKDLGHHQLKDIPQPEHLLQLAIAGLRSQFPAPKSLGTSSSLPRPATPLVGRDGELVELAALLSSPEVRLVTLTGPGGAGKTRLAVAMAEGLVDRFPDGVYFVPLATVTSVEVMWTSIAEVLDLPPEGRIPPGFFDHVAHRTALLVLDNLEQLDGADRVVAELLEQGPQVLVIASSRRPLNVPGEVQHAVPSLELPRGTTFDEAQRSGAVQMFVQRAQAVKGSFTLTADNAGEVVELCRRLDGLPLALELVAARSKMLSPSALLARLDTALDIAAAGSLATARQRTLRDTIAWSHDLLDPARQEFFRRLGVFAGGADLEAIAAVTVDGLNEADPLDATSELVDASLVTIAEDDQGEPRVGMLETIRIYALDQLRASAETDAVRRRHAEHYLRVAKEMHSKREGPAAQAARLKVESELDNIREALGWAFDCEQHSDEALAIGQEISAYVAWVWHMSGYHREGIHWLSSAIGVREPAAGEPYLRCLLGLSAILAVQGRLEEARKHAQTAVGQARELGKPSLLVEALLATALVEMSIGNEDHADTLLSEAVPHARGVDDPKLIRRALRGQAFLAAQRGTLERALELMREARQIDKEIGDEVGGLVDANNEAATLTALGRHAESLLIARGAVCGIARLNFPELVVAFTETYAEALVGTGRAETAARLFGSAAAMRERTHIPIEPSWKDYTAEPLRACREALSDEDWDREYEAGQNMTVEDALEHAHRATPPDGASN